MLRFKTFGGVLVSVMISNVRFEILCIRSIKHFHESHIICCLFQETVPFVFVGTVESIGNAKLLLEFHIDHLKV